MKDPRRFILPSITTGLALCLAVSTTTWADEFKIKRSQWDAEDNQLKIKGKGQHNEKVSISNAGSGMIIGSVTVNQTGKWELTLNDLATVPCRIHAESAGLVQKRDVRKAPADCDTGAGGGGGGTVQTSPLRVLAANDLGMHCADQDYQIFSILPPFNVVHAQVIEMGSDGSPPRILSDTDVDLVYSASSNLRDPVGPASINTTSFNGPGIFKSNFWEITDSGNTQGALGYASLYPSVLAVGLDSLCDPNPAIGCPSVLTAAFDPIPGDLGIPVPDPAHLPGLVVGQQAMPSAVNHAPFITSPYSANEPQPFDRFDVDLPFFTALPIGTTVLGVNWFAADGIPMLPVDDLGQSNAYPLMKVLAISKGTPPHITNNVLASTEVVLPVASEADCQGCHADPADLGNGAAANFASVSNYADGTPWEVMLTADAPGPEPLLNAAKINVLRLHDTKHGANYTSSVDASPLPCTSGSEVSCLDVRRNIQCSQCHYSPALDLAQIGPVDEPEQGIHGRQQTRHISMSRAMHGHHGEFTDLFPEMPAPSDPARTPELQAQVLQESCYQCHPGKRTQCLRGAMASGGVVCQDCHGNMKQVGNDFSKGLPGGTGLDLTRRVPWANEPQCQACHIGDVLTIAQADTSDFELAVDGIRLRQTYRKSDAMAASLPFISAPGSRFAEDQGLYRLSKGHGGVMCEGCHGSTYAIWPVQPDGDDVNSPFLANDNLAAIGLQGHTGTITECDTCHAPGRLGLTLDGPHGMHPVNNPNWTHRHESVAEQNPDSCRACHGSNGEGSVLARPADLRILESHDKQPDGSKQITLSRGTEVSCTLCHENKL